MANRWVAPALFLLALLCVDAGEARPGEVFGKRQLETSLPGKTKEEVRAMLGKPVSVDRNPIAYRAGDRDEEGSWNYGSQSSPTNTWSPSLTWIHSWTVVDESRAAPCWSVIVDFAHGKVSSVLVAACEGKDVQ